MRADSHCMPAACAEASSTAQLVQIEVSPTHPLLLLKQALPWEAITEVMTRHWREHGKNVDGGAGLPWDVSLYVPLVVLMLIKPAHGCRESTIVQPRAIVVSLIVSCSFIFCRKLDC